MECPSGNQRYYSVSRSLSTILSRPITRWLISGTNIEMKAKKGRHSRDGSTVK